MTATGDFGFFLPTGRSKNACTDPFLNYQQIASILAPKANQLEENTYEITWEPLQPMKGDSIVYILQLAAGREFDQVPSVSQNELEAFYLQKGLPTSSSWIVCLFVFYKSDNVLNS